MKVAIVHHWLIKMGGAEKVIEHLSDLYPHADIYTHVYNKSEISSKINKKTIKTTFINYLPFSSKLYKHYLVLMPFALKLLNLKKYDLIICSESGPTKGFRYNINATLVCYCHSPMRYIWDQETTYYKNFSFLEKIVSKIVFPFLRWWDVRTSRDMDLIIANSNFISKRILKFWGKTSKVVFPPINISDFKISNDTKKYFLVISRHVGYKKIDIAIKAFKKLNIDLKIIGDGPETEKLKLLSENSKNIEFLGWVTDTVKKDYLSNCKALIFPGIEDFGITPIEAMASGRPVIAYKDGGALDYIQDGRNGFFFNKQTVESLVSAIELFEKNKNSLDSNDIKSSISHFDSKFFNKNIKSEIKEVI